MKKTKLLNIASIVIVLLIIYFELLLAAEYDLETRKILKTEFIEKLKSSLKNRLNVIDFINEATFSNENSFKKGRLPYGEEEIKGYILTEESSNKLPFSIFYRISEKINDGQNDEVYFYSFDRNFCLNQYDVIDTFGFPSEIISSNNIEYCGQRFTYRISHWNLNFYFKCKGKKFAMELEQEGRKNICAHEVRYMIFKPYLR